MLAPRFDATVQFVRFPFGSAGGKRIGFGQPPLVFRYNGGVGGISGEVRVFTGVVPMVVKFFTAIPISDVSPVLTAHRVVAIIPRAEHRFRPLRIRIFEQR